MKYFALMRGINVGGNNIIKMADLKKTVAESGFTSVSTYIQSGNIIFKSEENDIDKITKKLEEALFKVFGFNSGIIVKTLEQLNKIISEVPDDWKKRHDLRCYIAFIRKPVSEQDVMRDIKLKDGVDFVKAGDKVLYMSTLLEGLTKSGFTKLVGTKIYKDITIRNYNTTQKILALMQ
jgi:uncharacterized protein (DUF1697 family)